jgi:two-component system, chemotaxis family, protein-glutamate methylesterase/glutaminase
VKCELIIVGVSAGGLNALSMLLGGLPAWFRTPVVMVQHRSSESVVLCEMLQDCSARPVHEVVDKQPIEAGHVYLAPPDYHLLLEPGSFSLSVDEPELYSRPSVNIAFESAAAAYGAAVTGVVLTGANRDGARGLRTIRRRGGRAIVQDPATAEVARMPAAALEEVPDAVVLPLPDIAAYLVDLEKADGPGTGSTT